MYTESESKSFVSTLLFLCKSLKLLIFNNYVLNGRCVPQKPPNQHHATLFATFDFITIQNVCEKVIFGKSNSDHERSIAKPLTRSEILLDVIMIQNKIIYMLVTRLTRLLCVKMFSSLLSFFRKTKRKNRKKYKNQNLKFELMNLH